MWGVGAPFVAAAGAFDEAGERLTQAQVPFSVNDVAIFELLLDSEVLLLLPRFKAFCGFVFRSDPRKMGWWFTEALLVGKLVEFSASVVGDSFKMDAGDELEC